MAAKATGTRVSIVNVGDDVYYFSSSYDEWIKGKVLALNEDNSYELDIKSGAHPSLVIKNPTPEDLKTKPVREVEQVYIAPAPQYTEETVPPSGKVSNSFTCKSGAHPSRNFSGTLYR
jgi:hypothetical protein